MTLYLLTLVACLSTVPAARGDLVRVAVREAQAQTEAPYSLALRAAQEVRADHPWALVVSIDEDAPHVLHVRLGPGAPPDALDELAEAYSLMWPSRAPVEAWGYSCAEWMWTQNGPRLSELRTIDTAKPDADPMRGVEPARQVCKDGVWTVSGRSVGRY